MALAFSDCTRSSRGARGIQVSQLKECLRHGCLDASRSGDLPHIVEGLLAAADETFTKDGRKLCRAAIEACQLNEVGRPLDYVAIFKLIHAYNVDKSNNLHDLSENPDGIDLDLAYYLAGTGFYHTKEQNPQQPQYQSTPFPSLRQCIHPRQYSLQAFLSAVR